MKRYNHRKTITAVLTAAALLMAGCQKQPFDAPGSSDANQLTFNASLDGQPVAQPRAAGADTDLKTHGFYLAGYYTTGLIDAAVATAVPNVFNKEENDHQIAVPLVTYAQNKFTLKTIKWALNDITYLSFFGWSQSKPIPTTGVTAATTGIIGQTKDDNDKGYPWVEIRNADAPADQTDVVGSRSLDHKNDAVISAVDLDFHHLLSKLTFKAKSSSKANIAITAVNIKYAADKVRKKARYTFSSNAAAIGAFSAFDEYHSGTVALGTTYPAITEGAEVVLGSALLLPQQLAAGDVSIEIKYKLSPNSSDVEGPEQTKTLPLAAFTFEQGNNYLYTIDIQAAEVFVPSYPIITNWEIVASPLPVVAGAMDGKTLLLLDGYDRPYIHTDGKVYWLDRSGYNRHVELTANNISYDVPNRGYVFNWTKGGDIPNLVGTQVTGVTIDVVASGTANGQNQQPFSLSPFFSAMPPVNTYSEVDWYYMNGAQQNILTWTAASGDIVRGLSHWSFTYGNNRARIYHNAMLRAESTITSSPQTIAKATLANYYSGRISYLKITNEERGQGEIVADYNKHKNRFNIVAPTNPVNPPSASDYVKIGSLYWAKGNLVATSSTASELNGCKVGAPEDGGLFFQFGSLIGWKGGNSSSSGTGEGTPSYGSGNWGGAGSFSWGNDAMVWPTAMDGNRPTAWSPNTAQATEADAFKKWFFDFTGTSGGVNYATDFSDIRDYTHPTLGALKEGKMAWLGVGDPCTYYLGDPWRLPTAAEVKVLFDNVANKTVWSSVANWSWITSPYNGAQRTGNSLYVPASGYRGRANAGFGGVGSSGYGWSSSLIGMNGYGHIVNGNEVLTQSPEYRSTGIPVRCVSTAP